MVASLCSNYSILAAIAASVIGGRVAMGGALTASVPLPPPPLSYGQSLRKYEHHHMSNKIVPATDQRMKVTVFVHPSLRNLIRVVLDLHDCHHYHYEVVRRTAVHKK
jgi:hypothetical protein